MAVLQTLNCLDFNQLPPPPHPFDYLLKLFCAISIKLRSCWPLGLQKHKCLKLHVHTLVKHILVYHKQIQHRICYEVQYKVNRWWHWALNTSWSMQKSDTETERGARNCCGELPWPFFFKSGTGWLAPSLNTTCTLFYTTSNWLEGITQGSKMIISKSMKELTLNARLWKVLRRHDWWVVMSFLLYIMFLWCNFFFLLQK